MNCVVGFVSHFPCKLTVTGVSTYAKSIWAFMHVMFWYEFIRNMLYIYVVVLADIVNLSYTRWLTLRCYDCCLDVGGFHHIRYPADQMMFFNQSGEFWFMTCFMCIYIYIHYVVMMLVFQVVILQ